MKLESEKLVLVPGVSQKWAQNVYQVPAALFSQLGWNVKIARPDWSGKEVGFVEMEKRFMDVIDKFYGGGDRVNLVAVSAGGLLSIEALANVDGVISDFLRQGSNR
ncbi:MAG: hypothetical protein ACOX6N_00415 [Patescibacteria group bacterium]